MASDTTYPATGALEEIIIGVRSLFLSQHHAFDALRVIRDAYLIADVEVLKEGNVFVKTGGAAVGELDVYFGVGAGLHAYAGVVNFGNGCGDGLMLCGAKLPSNNELANLVIHDREKRDAKKESHVGKKSVLELWVRHELNDLRLKCGAFAHIEKYG